jgi:hypothetical protein
MKNKYYLYLLLSFFSFFLPFISSFSLSLAYNNNTNSYNITLLNLPLYFIENKGQIKEKIDNEEIKYYLNLPNQNILFTENSVYLTYYLKDNKVKTIKLSLNNKNKTKIIPLKKQEGKVNYFIGNNKENWKTNIDIYEAIIYKNVYDNVDIKFFTDKHKKLKYDIIINPPIDIEKIEKEIKLTYYHLDDLYINKENNNLEGIVITNEKTKEKTIILNQEKPLIYQQENENKKQEIKGQFNIIEKDKKNKKYTFSFKIDENDINKIDKNKKLIIDPPIVTLYYSTYLGGSNNDYANSITVDNSGYIYITGHTLSNNFPTSSAFQGSLAGSNDAFVTKFSTSGNSLIFSTYLGGSNGDSANSITVDNLGYIYITGHTLSNNFPTSSAFQGSLAGLSDAFVTKFSTSGNSLIFSTYLGGSNNDSANSITVDNSGYIYITGVTFSTNFPTSSAFQGSLAGFSDAFVTKFSTSGNSLIFSTYLGGSSSDYTRSITVDNSGYVYITGYTLSTNFPTSSAFQGSLAGSDDAFVTKFSTSGNSLIFSTYLGGSSSDYTRSITVDNSGYVYITGYTLSTNFPTSSAFQGSLAGFSDAFVTKFSTSGNSLIFSTYLGGSNGDFANSITVDNSGYVYITGITRSNNFPLKNPYQNTNQGNYDIFISKLSEIRVQFTSSTVSNPESINTYLIEISLPSTSTEDIQVNYSIIGGTATVGQDYTLSPVSLIIPAGSTTTYLPINIINDDIDEPDETIILSIFSPTNALLGENTTFTYIILDDDLPSSPSSLSNNYVSGSNIYFQVKNLIEKNNKKQAEKLIKEYLHLFKKEKLLKEYPNLFIPQELTFIFTITGDIKNIENIENIEEIIKEVKEVKEKQETKKIIKTTNKYITLKQKLNSHPLKNYFINNCQSFKKTLKINTKDKEVKCLKIILNLDKETEIKGQINKENNIFDNKTRLSLIKFQRKYNIKEERGIVGSKTRRILNEILSEIRR